jgi:phytoene dehydrogenase-like protein
MMSEASRQIPSPASSRDLEARDENLVGGAIFDQELFFRPVFLYFRYRTPVLGLYLASAPAHPGAGCMALADSMRPEWH